METPQGEHIPQSVVDVLLSASGAWRESDLQGHSALHIQGDVGAYRQTLRARAQLLVDLPDRLEELRVAGVEVPRSIATTVGQLALQAREGLADMEGGQGVGFAIAAALTYPGAARGDPNILEELAGTLGRGEA